MSKQYELSILRQALQDIKLRVGEMEEWLNESSEKPREPMLEVGQKVYVAGSNAIPDGPYSILEYDDGDGSYCVDYKDGWWVYSSELKVFQPLLSGPFDASRIPKDKVPGYMVWVESTSLAVKTGWHPIIQMCHDGGSRGVCIDGELGFRWHDFDGKGPVYGVTLHFQPPEKVNAEPSDELLLRVIEEMPWVVEWCRSGKCEDGRYGDCPHGGMNYDICPAGKDSLCYKLFGIYNNGNVKHEDCPCNHKSIGSKKVNSVKSRIVKLAEEKRTYKVGDCFKRLENGLDVIYIFSGHDEDWRLIAIGTNHEFSNKHVNKEDAKRGVHLDRLTRDPSLLTYLGPFSEVFSRKI